MSESLKISAVIGWMAVAYLITAPAPVVPASVPVPQSKSIKVSVLTGNAGLAFTARGYWPDVQEATFTQFGFGCASSTSLGKIVYLDSNRAEHSVTPGNGAERWATWVARREQIIKELDARAGPQTE